MNPYEKFTLNSLSQGLAGGLDPGFAQGIFQNTIDAAHERQQRQQQTVLGLQQLAMQQATAGVPEGVASDFVGSVEQNYPFLSKPNPFATRSRESIQSALAGLYPGAGDQSLSPVHTAPELFSAGLQQSAQNQAAQVQVDYPALEAEVAAAAIAARDALAADENGVATGGLAPTADQVEGRHATWARIMARYAAQGLDPETKARISNWIGVIWDSAGGPPPADEMASGASPAPTVPGGGNNVGDAFRETGLGVFPWAFEQLSKPRSWIP